MQRHALSFLILAFAIALPAQAKHHHHAKAVPKLAATPAPAPVRVSMNSSKGSRLVAQIPLPGAKGPAGKQVAAKTAAKPAPAVVAASAKALPASPTPIQCLARLTAYWTQEDPWTAKHESSTGVHLAEGYCAVDPKLIPYGSTIQIPGMRPYVAVDTGSAVISRRAAVGSGHTDAERNALVVDLFFENRKDAENFAAHGPAYVSVSWTQPLALADAPKNPRALPASMIPKMPADTVYILAEAPSMADVRMPLAFRTPQL